MSEKPYVPFYKPYGMTDEEYQHEVERAKERLAEWEFCQWMEELTLECECCPICWDVPCAGCMAGGICDSMCICGQDGDEDDESCFDEDED